MRASYILATHQRPEMLACVLDAIAATHIPDRWELDVLVVGADDDPGRQVAEERGATYIVEQENIIGAKWNQALYASDADLVLLTGDDDIQSPRRLAAAVAAFNLGAVYSCCDCAWFYNRITGQAALWESYAGNIGATVNLDAHYMRARGGWFELTKNNDNALRNSLAKSHVFPHTVDGGVGLDTVCTHGADNVSNRPWPAVGESVAVGKGKTRITGTLPANLPLRAREALGIELL